MHAPVLIEQAGMVVGRLERLSADSIWAHLACGYRGALLRSMERLEESAHNPQEAARLEWLIGQGFILLENAARELVVPDDLLDSRSR